MKRGPVFLLYALSLFLVGSTPTYTPPIALEVREGPIPNRTLVWKYTPSIIICDHSPADEVSVKNAIKWWVELGYTFYGPYISGHYKQKCFESSPNGVILITLVSGTNYSHENVATTTIYSDKNTNEILWARIELKEGQVKERVLEHEIGHALGWMHSKRRGHIMNRRLPDGGWSAEGLMLINNSTNK